MFQTTGHFALSVSCQHVGLRRIEVDLQPFQSIDKINLRNLRYKQKSIYVTLSKFLKHCSLNVVIHKIIHLKEIYIKSVEMSTNILGIVLKGKGLINKHFIAW